MAVDEDFFLYNEVEVELEVAAATLALQENKSEWSFKIFSDDYFFLKALSLFKMIFYLTLHILVIILKWKIP